MHALLWSLHFSKNEKETSKKYRNPCGFPEKTGIIFEGKGMRGRGRTYRFKCSPVCILQHASLVFAAGVAMISALQPFALPPPVLDPHSAPTQCVKHLGCADHA